MKFSVLMSIYYKEKPEYFNRCMQSIWNEQSLKPNEIILVQDGQLIPELYVMIDNWKQKLGDIFKTIPLEKNVGLGDALNIGLQECIYEIVARMDTDDIAMPDRFEKQLKVFEDGNIDVCSSWVSEFDNDEQEVISYRKLPENHSDIVDFAKKRNPLNHPAIMYKKSIVLRAGGYKKMMWFEDYYLWVRMTLKGAKFYNIQEPLVNMRAGYGQLERRSGLNYIKAEMRFLHTIRKEGFLNSYEFVRNVIVRLIARAMPKKVLKVIYKRLRN